MLKVKSSTNPTMLAGAICHSLEEQSEIKIQGIGAGALNQAIKAIAIANDYRGNEYVEYIARPRFVDLEIDGEPKSAIQIIVRKFEHD